MVFWVIISYMIQEKYIQKIREIINDFDKSGNKYFIFGSALIEDKFADVDIAVEGDVDIPVLKEKFIESDLPYKVDIVSLDDCDESFVSNIKNNKILWIRP